MSAATGLIRGSRRKPGFLAAMLHRLSGVALALFLPMHFIVLGLALGGAKDLDAFLQLTRAWPVRIAEWGLVTSLALHMALGLRILAIEFLSFRAKTASVVSVCCASAAAVGLLFLLGGA
ncbi:succinate dehydrogenase, cytochrome b556 subunit [Methylocella silvestris]|uniref:Succinate dehydrogenase n=1 Tax=Methylocella silvestris TaxID=199596 RepID=A0A2J7TC56_METSI|nr:succinate dehydrogenase [Methylocella silvestris]PNG24346.1 succinate dehydrogenase [Methylocella silvestris]